MGNCTFIDGIASSQALDTSGEVVDLKGLDITSLKGAAINYEHKKDLPAQLVGKILEAKKIFGKEDCENPRHIYFWNKIQLPFLYIKARLLDDRKPSAKEVAALFQDDAAHPEEPDMLGFSVEGSKIEKVGAVITRSIARLVTLANMPANKTCISEMVPEVDAKIDPNDISELFKGEMQLFAFEPTYIQILDKKEEMKKDVGSGGGAFIGSQLAMSQSNAQPSEKPIYQPHSKRKEEGKHYDVGLKNGLQAKYHHASNAFHPFANKGTEIDKMPYKGHQGTNKMHKEEPLMKPYTSEAQRRWAHTDAGKEALGGEAGVHEWDEATKGKKLPERVKKAEKMKKDATVAPDAPASASTVSAQPDKPSSSTQTVGIGIGRMSGMGRGGMMGMNKALSAGSGNAAPGQLAGGAVLAAEDLDKKKMHKKEKSKWYDRADQAYQTWDKREHFRKYMKERMPHLAEGEVDSIGRVLALKKNLQAEGKLSKMYSSYFSKGTDSMMASEKKKKD
jgi:hypothetical protein